MERTSKIIFQKCSNVICVSIEVDITPSAHILPKISIISDMIASALPASNIDTIYVKISIGRVVFIDSALPTTNKNRLNMK